ncbi:T9SS type A sorting domain-containing protein [Dysgonomonas sp.]
MKIIRILSFVIFLLIINSISAQTGLIITSGQGTINSFFNFQSPIPEVFTFKETRVWSKSTFGCAVLYYLPLTRPTRLKIEVSYEGPSATTIAGIIITPTEYIEVVRTSHEMLLPPGNYNIGVAPVHSSMLGQDIFSTIFANPTYLDCSCCVPDVQGKLTISLQGNVPTSNSNYYSYDTAGNRITRTIILNTLQTNLKSGIADIKPSVLEDDIVEVKIYPNPTKGQLTIEIPDTANRQRGSITIYNMNGQVITKSAISSHRESIDISSKADGVYIMQISLDGKISSWKIIKN